MRTVVVIDCGRCVIIVTFTAASITLSSQPSGKCTRIAPVRCALIMLTHQCPSTAWFTVFELTPLINVNMVCLI